MAEADVEKGEQKTGVARRPERRLWRSTKWDPFAWWLRPSEFFSSSPFSLMRRFSEEMDHAFGRFFERPSSGKEVTHPMCQRNLYLRCQSFADFKRG
jgi:hypothetical protein